jgi:class 3 adenylate cyclase
MTRSQVRIIDLLVLLIAAMIIGAAYGAFLDYFLSSNLTIEALLRGSLRGLIVGSILWLFELSLVNSRPGQRLRQAPFLISLFVRTILTTLVLIGAVTISRLILRSQGHSFEQWLEIGFARDFIFVAFVALLAHFALQTRRLVGGNTLLYFLLGRYNQPVLENRIFMLIDIIGSTAIAQQLGEQKALALITRFFFDIAEPVQQFDGETNLYVGDEVVISWPLGDRHQNSRYINCYFAICDLLERNQKLYLGKFGKEIMVRVGVHGGPIAVGECGDAKRQVVFVGDTINVAKRLQEACREFGQDILVSGSLLEKTELPNGITAKKIGRQVLRGRDNETEIYGLSK